ncbi:hypothetical protein D3C71_1036120 [compost metagenome]
MASTSAMKPVMIRPYSSLLQGQGRSMQCSGSPTHAACSVSNCLRTPCMATRSNA